ncbi:MAG: hypothetical protein ACHRXM_05625, partial [Isosphaerales bacterium]
MLVSKLNGRDRFRRPVTTKRKELVRISVAVPTALSTTSLSVGAPVRFAGFVAPFGQAPPDFNASTLLSFAQTRALLDLKWPPSG